MIIIVEGIDRVGKTTLCEKIIEAFPDLSLMRFRDDTRYVHTYQRMEVNTEKINTLQNLMEQGFVDNVILDRYHLTEWVYGGVDRQYKNDEMWDIDERLSKMGNKVILIYVQPTDIIYSSEAHGKNLRRHNAWFNEAYVDTAIKNKIVVDYTTLNEAIEYIKEVIDYVEPEKEEMSVEVKQQIFTAAIAAYIGGTM